MTLPTFSRHPRARGRGHGGSAHVYRGADKGRRILTRRGPWLGLAISSVPRSSLPLLRPVPSRIMRTRADGDSPRAVPAPAARPNEKGSPRLRNVPQIELFLLQSTWYLLQCSLIIATSPERVNLDSFCAGGEKQAPREWRPGERSITSDHHASKTGPLHSATTSFPFSTFA
jgi:hypothetical protein